MANSSDFISCPNCQTNNLRNAKFCRFCGTGLRSTSSKQSQQTGKQIDTNIKIDNSRSSKASKRETEKIKSKQIRDEINRESAKVKSLRSRENHVMKLTFSILNVSRQKDFLTLEEINRFWEEQLDLEQSYQVQGLNHELVNKAESALASIRYKTLQSLNNLLSKRSGGINRSLSISKFGQLETLTQIRDINETILAVESDTLDLFNNFANAELLIIDFLQNTERDEGSRSTFMEHLNKYFLHLTVYLSNLKVISGVNQIPVPKLSQSILDSFLIAMQDTLSDPSIQNATNLKKLILKITKQSGRFYKEMDGYLSKLKNIDHQQREIEFWHKKKTLKEYNTLVSKIISFLNLEAEKQKQIIKENDKMNLSSISPEVVPFYTKNDHSEDEIHSSNKKDLLDPLQSFSDQLAELKPLKPFD